MPTAEAGAAHLAGAWIAVTTNDDLLADRLFRPRRLDRRPPLRTRRRKQAALSRRGGCGRNFPLAALAMSRRLFEAVGVDFAVAGPLVEAVVANARDGTEQSLTGPVARGDIGTIRASSPRCALQPPTSPSTSSP